MALLCSLTLLFMVSPSLAAGAYYHCYSSSTYNGGSSTEYDQESRNSYLFVIPTATGTMDHDGYYFARSVNSTRTDPAELHCLGLFRVEIIAGVDCFACLHQSCSAITSRCSPKLEISGYSGGDHLGLCLPNMTKSACTGCLRAAPADRRGEHCQGAILFSSSCILRNERYSVYNFSSITLLSSPPKLSPPASHARKGGRNRRTLVTAIVVPMVVMSTAAAVVKFLANNIQKRRKQNRADKDGAIETESTDLCLEFSLKTIRSATDNFSVHNKLGQGGFGAVYKGMLHNGQHIAVKKLAVHSVRGEVEFKNEVHLVARLHHKNLIRLIGFCIEGKERLLIYELALNGSLDRILFDPIRREQLKWEIRYSIIEGIARGVLYLHEESQQRIIHRDLKPSNILLDESMNAKISDFGTARLYVEDQSSASKIVGTYGYMAPEYVKHGKISVKIDVFSFGVLLLEIVCGKKNSASKHRDHIDHLLSKAWKYWTAGRLEELIDPVLMRGNGHIDEIARCIHIGLLCVQGEAACRPTINVVIVMLEDCSQSLPPPLQPAYFMLISDDEPRRIDQNHPVSSEPNSGHQQTNMSSYSSNGFSSVNEITITQYPEPR